MNVSCEFTIIAAIWLVQNENPTNYKQISRNQGYLQEIQYNKVE